MISDSSRVRIRRMRALVWSLLIAVGAVFFGAGCGGWRMGEALHLYPGYIPVAERYGVGGNAAPAVFVPPLTLAWEQDIAAGVGSEPPLFVDSLLLIGNLRGELCALHLRDGSKVGSIGLGNAIPSSPAINGLTAYVALAGMKESLLAFDLRDGLIRWKRPCGDLQGSPLFLKDRLYVGNTSGTFLCIDAASGEEIWTYEIPANTRLKGIRATAAGDSTGVLFGAEDGFIYALDPATGTLRWRLKVDGAVEAPVVTHGLLVMASTIKGTLYAIERASGTLRWAYHIGAPLYARVQVAEGLAIVGATNGIVSAISLADGKLAWDHVVKGPINAGVVISGGYIFVGTLKKELLALDLRKGTAVWTTSVPGRIKTTLAASGNIMVVTTDEPSILAFRGSSP